MKIAAIQVAAGLSSRMGDSNKLLETVGDGECLVQHSFKSLLNASFDQLVLVTGRDADKVTSSLNHLITKSTIIVHNPNYSHGMTSSIQAGLDEIKNQADAVMICLADMPLLRTEDYYELVDAFKSRGGKDKILVPWFGKERGNPVIFGCDFFEDIMNHTQPNGCSGVIKQYSDQVINYQVSSNRFTFDIDTPEDLKAYKELVNERRPS